MPLPRREQHDFLLARPRRRSGRRHGRPGIERLEARTLLATHVIRDTNIFYGDPDSLNSVLLTLQAGDVIAFDIPTTDPGFDPATRSWYVPYGDYGGPPIPPLPAGITFDGT